MKILISFLLCFFSFIFSEASPVHISHHEFRINEARFVPRGANYTRLGANQYHITFSQYDAWSAESSLRQLAHDGYNVVRIFLEPGDVALALSPQLNPIYLNHLFDFIRRAQSLGIYVVICKDIWLPQSYISAYVKPDLFAEFGNANSPAEFNINQMIMDPSFIRAAQIFWSDIAREIVNANLKSHVISFDVYQEAHYRAEFYPFSKTKGVFIPYTQVPYRMDLSADRQQLADALAVEYAIQLRKSIREQFPEALVTISLFTPLDIGQPGYNGLWPSPGKDQRRPFRKNSLEIYSTLDYMSVHLYSSDGSNSYLERALSSIEIAKFQVPSKPLVIDEIGLFQRNYSNLVSAARSARLQIDLLCDYKVTGWLFWTLNTFEQPGFIHLLMGQGEVNGLLAPIAHQDSQCGL